MTPDALRSLKPFSGKGAHYNWARRVGLQGPVCVLVNLPRAYNRMAIRPQPILIHTGVNPDGSGMWGEWIMEVPK